MSKFKVGDRVRIAESSEYYNGGGDSNPKNVAGTVDGTVDGIKGSNYSIHAEWDNGGANIYRESDLELVQSKPEFKVGHGAICIKENSTYNVGDVLLISEVTFSGNLGFGELGRYYSEDYFTPCPNPPLPHYKERIAYALGAEIELNTSEGVWEGMEDSVPLFDEGFKYSVAIPDIHAEEREKIKREIAQLQKKLDGLGGEL